MLRTRLSRKPLATRENYHLLVWSAEARTSCRNFWAFCREPAFAIELSRGSPRTNSVLEVYVEVARARRFQISRGRLTA